MGCFAMFSVCFTMLSYMFCYVYLDALLCAKTTAREGPLSKCYHPPRRCYHPLSLIASIEHYYSILQHFCYPCPCCCFPFPLFLCLSSLLFLCRFISAVVASLLCLPFASRVCFPVHLSLARSSDSVVRPLFSSL
jgi:hypothetical protein